MKVMHLGPGFSSSGVTAGMFCLAKYGFYNQFDDFRIVGTSKGDTQAYEKFFGVIEPEKVTFITPYSASAGSSRLSQRLHGIRQQIDAFSPDAIILSTSGSVIEGRLAARHYPELKVVTFEHHTLSHLPEKRKRALRNTSRVNHLIFGDAPVTIDITKNTLYAFGNEDVPSFVIPLTIPEFGSPRLPEVVNNFEVLSLGRLDTEKNYFELLHATANLIKEGYRFNLTIAGKGKQHKDLQILAGNLGISQYISLPGYIENPSSLRSKSHIYIQPSLTEGLCLGFIEAAAGGMVVVGTDIGGMKDYGIDNHNMIKIHGFDRCAIAEALRRAFDNYSTAAPSLSKNAIDMATSHFSNDVVREAWKTAGDALKNLCAPIRLMECPQDVVAATNFEFV